MKSLFPNIQNMTNALDENSQNFSEVVNKITTLFETFQSQEKKKTFNKNDFHELVIEFGNLTKALNQNSKSFAKFTKEYREFIDKYIELANKS